MIRVNDFKRSYLFKKRLEDLPLVIVFMNNKATYRLCRFNYNGYYYKYVCFGLSATANKGEILKVHSSEDKSADIS